MPKFYSVAPHSHNKRTPFQVLSLSENASTADVKKRYYELAKTLHPDKPTGDVEEFRQVVRAYELLSDPGKRSMYMRTGLGWDVAVPSSTSWGDPWASSPGQRPASYTNAYWAAQDDIRYKGGPWSSHETPRYMSNRMFFSIVAGLALVVGVAHFAHVLGSHSSFISAADRHHLRTSRDLERARTEAQLFGNQRAVERMLENRMKYFRDGNDTSSSSSSHGNSSSDGNNKQD
ncbi:DnaJ-domain-containing protein [Lichtheimia hyalospora FSU 10163]|nr:DnaJ-domain-containing protein [Lichtheimia hyalospora FSU 10163]